MKLFCLIVGGFLMYAGVQTDQLHLIFAGAFLWGGPWLAEKA